MPIGLAKSSAYPNPGENYQYTTEEVREFVKCAQDPVYFIRNYYKIINMDKGLTNFDMYDFQEKMVRSYHENRFNITMCSRQVGKSTTVVAYFLYLILFNVNYSACISANKQKTAVDLLGKIKLAYEHLPRFLQQGVVKWAQTEIELENGSRVFASATSSSSVRGGSFNILLMDEFAFVPENMASEFYTSTFPAISSGKTTKIIMVSTPNGMNLFHKFWTDAQHKRNNFAPIFVHWKDVPGRDNKWREETIKDIGGADKFAQEYECSFLAASYTLISAQKLQTLSYNEPIYIDNKGYQEYEAPIEGHSYVMTIDTATGQGLDASTFAITDVTTMPYKVVATYGNNKIKTMEFPGVINEYGKRFFHPWALIEINDIGRDIANILWRDYEYPHILTVSTQDKRQGQKLSFGTGANRHLGVRMTPAVKRSGCALIKALVENDQLILSDHRFISEFSTFIQDGSSFAAQEGHHDDHVMSLVLLGWATLQPAFAEIARERAIETYTKIKQLAEDAFLPVTIKPRVDEHNIGDHDESSGSSGYESDDAPLPLPVTNDVYDPYDNAWLHG